MSDFTIISYQQRPELESRSDNLDELWPDFIHHNEAAARYYPAMFEHFGAFQLYWLSADDEAAAAGHSVPLAWDGTVEGLPAGRDAALAHAIEGCAAALTPTTLCSLNASVAPDYLGRGLGTQIMRALCALAREHGFESLIAPVRPTLKSAYPRMTLAQYLTWKRADGTFFDPWLRVHQTLGAEVLTIAERSLTIQGTVAQWEAWTSMRFPHSGEYVVPGALVPVIIDCAANRGVYVEPNVWMVHRV
ncbi:MAG: GNAT family N-acetyltransferase [Anaerolineae bacterium]|nr:GNAT family N-acetyltransferase [Anaerolineae bacterium]